LVRSAVGLALLLSGCALFQSERARCAATLDAAWSELDVSKAEGFAALVSYGRAAALIAEAKLEQAQERFVRCIDAGERARFYIMESRAGR
jgi:hypothetical protein